MEIDLFRYLDIVIAFASVMLLASSLVTMITQRVINWAHYRSAVLQDGLSRMIHRFGPTLTTEETDQIAGEILRHPLIAEENGRAGSVIRREELVRILLAFARNNVPTPAIAEKLRGLLSGDPTSLIARIESRAAEFEALAPELSTQVRQSRAIIEAQAGQFVSGLMNWFDDASERMTQRFATKAKRITVWASIAVAFLLPLDSLELFKRLSADDKLRSALIAKQIEATSTPGGEINLEKLRQENVKIKAAIAELTDSKLAIVPEGWWRGQLGLTGGAPLDPIRLLRSLFGVALSAVLLSLGAPFWYAAVKNLLRLRPAGADKEDADRAERRSTQSAPPPPQLAGSPS